MKIEAIDHIVLTVKDMDASISFYVQVLGMRVTTFGGNRKALLFGTQKINLHQYGQEPEPKAKLPTPGSADLCFITTTDLAEIIDQLDSSGIDIVEGPVQRTGAVGRINSVYFRDPDGNLIEVSNYEEDVAVRDNPERQVTGE